MLCYAWGHLQEREPARLAPLAGISTAQDLLGKVLAGGINRLLRRGITRGYVERREDFAGIRGKVAMGETVKRALRARGQVACDFEELSADFLPNRILRASLQSLLRPGIEMDCKVRGEVRAAYLRLGGVAPIRLRRNLFGQVNLGANRRLYRFLISVCGLIYESALVSEKSGATGFFDFRRDEAVMWRLFEEFVTGFYEREQIVYRVNPNGRKIRWTNFGSRDEFSRSHIPGMYADLILDSPDRRLIVDTKFYRDAVSGSRYGGHAKLNSANLYQLLAYLRNRQAGIPEGAWHEGMLLYPETNARMRIDIKLEGYWIQARSVNLNQHWKDLHNELLDVIGVASA
jgi:5-methylcytosine-specific restriction enzyme subunit McrC